jgi:hypothetical protein
MLVALGPEMRSPLDNSMVLIRPRLTDFYGISTAQAELDFAIPFLDDDIPLYVDPFLMWKSPSQQDQALHTAITNSFNHLNFLLTKSRDTEAGEILVQASECAEVGLGHSKKRVGNRIGVAKADEILTLFRQIEHYGRYGFTHFEEIQLYVRDISRDRVSDIACSFIKSFLIDYTTQACEDLGVPTQDVAVPLIYNYKTNRFDTDKRALLPVNPETGAPVILVPKRWLRFGSWINFDEYFRDYCPQDEIFNPGEPRDPVKVLRYNREHYGVVKEYVSAKERRQADCHSDPLFKQIPVTSAKSKYAEIAKLPTGKTNNADRRYEDLQVQLLASLLYPHLDFAAEQSRTDSGVLIRDLIFYNNRGIDFLKDIYADYGSQQLVFELKNVAAIDRDHINQLNRYLDAGLGRFGVFVTRNPLSRAMFQNTVDLWSGQRRCLITLTDEDVSFMVNVFESRQRPPIDILKKKYVEFRRACPS